MPFKMTILRIRAHRGGHHKALPDAEVIRIKGEIPTLPDTRQRLSIALLVYTLVADLLGHVDARMVETTCARPVMRVL